MSKTLDQAIEELAADIGQLESELRRKKETVNTLCSVNGRAPLYSLENAATGSSLGIRSDLFYGQPLATAVRTILEMRRMQDLGAASINEIHEALVQGGYQFHTKSEEVARQSLRNSLSKNNTTFHKLPNGRFGLLAWYPNVRQARSAAATNGADHGGDEEPVQDQNEEAATETSAAAS
ncbi:MAG: hypothetical protein ACJ8F3_05410 [Xanthobacteraceae bacterium]